MKNQDTTKFKESCAKLTRSITSLNKSLTEYFDNVLALSAFLENNQLVLDFHHDIIVVKFTDAVKKSALSGMLIDAILLRFIDSMKQYIKHGIPDTSKSFEMVNLAQNRVECGHDYLKAMSQPFGYHYAYNPGNYSHVKRFIAHAQIYLKKISSVAEKKYVLLVSSRNLIIQKNFKIYFSLLKDHFKKSFDEYNRCSDEISSIKHEAQLSLSKSILEGCSPSLFKTHNKKNDHKSEEEKAILNRMIHSESDESPIDLELHESLPSCSNKIYINWDYLNKLKPKNGEAPLKNSKSKHDNNNVIENHNKCHTNNLQNTPSISSETRKKQTNDQASSNSKKTLNKDEEFMQRMNGLIKEFSKSKDEVISYGVPYSQC